MEAAAAGRVRPISELRDDVPGEIVQAVAQGLEADPQRRFASCAAFVAALPSAARIPPTEGAGDGGKLTRLLESAPQPEPGLATTATTATDTLETRRPRQRGRLAVVALVTAALGAAAGALGMALSTEAPGT